MGYKPLYCNGPGTDPIKKDFFYPGEKVFVEKPALSKDPERYKDGIFLFRGMKDRAEIKTAKKHGIPFFYVDSGYIGNIKRKVYGRVIYNDLHFNSDKEYPTDRLEAVFAFLEEKFEIKKTDLFKEWKYDGKKILFCPPIDITGFFYEFDIKEWKNSVVEQIQAQTNKEIVVREHPKKSKVKKTINQSIYAFDDVYIVVAYSSAIAVDAVIGGVPAMCLGPNAAQAVSIRNIENINSPVYPDRIKWMSALAYHQYTFAEMFDSTVFDNLNFWEHCTF